MLADGFTEDTVRSAVAGLMTEADA
jgi:hypothetical protein